MSDTHSLQKRQVSLEDAFFLAQERKILENRRAQRQLEENKRNLAAASGIRNEAVLDKMLSLHIRPETLASLALVPLVEVAWCDGHMTAAERQAVLDACKRQTGGGTNQPELNQELLAQWLTHRPDQTLFDVWEQYVKELCGLLSAKERQSLQQEILAHADQVARASGGILGLAKVSAAEEKCQARIKAAFA